MLGLGLCLGECSGPWTLVGLVVIVDGEGNGFDRESNWLN